MGGLIKFVIVLSQLLCVIDFVVSKNVFQMSIQPEKSTDNDRETVLEALKSAPVKSGDVSFSFAKHFQNNMVLQRAPARANIYGFSPDIGQKVILQMNTPSKPYYYTTHVVASATPGVGVWMITLDPLEANMTANIKVLSERGTLNLGNLIFGDVWLCGGQSNMQFSVHQMNGAAEEIADAHNYPNIRLFTAALKSSPTPVDDLIDVEESWASPSNDSVGHSDWSYFSAVCWVYGKAIHKALNVPIGLVATNWGGTPVEAWSSPDALKKCGLDNEESSSTENNNNLYSPENRPSSRSKNLAVGGPGDNSVLYNAMIHPFLKMTIYGAIWYQGEADASGDKMAKYGCTFPAMIEDWRAKFNQASSQTSATFPFGFVQLAGNRNDPTITTGFPDIRWHQTADMGYVPNPKMKNVFMAVAMDLPDFNSTYGSIHPRDKMDVGTRLALSGLEVAYQKNEVFQGPFPKGGSSQGKKFILDYGSGTKLQVLNKEGFEFLCQDPNSNKTTWKATAILDSDDSTVTLDTSVCNNVTLLKGVRYAWRESPCEFKKCAIYESVNSLPGPPFELFVEPPSNDNTIYFTSPHGEGVITF